MQLDGLPCMDIPVEIGASKFTRKQVISAFRADTDTDLTQRTLAFARDCRRAFEPDSGVFGFVFPASKMAELEIAQILYFDCIPDDNPLKREFSEREVLEYTAAARLWFYHGKPVPYLQ